MTAFPYDPARAAVARSYLLTVRARASAELALSDARRAEAAAYAEYRRFMDDEHQERLARAEAVVTSVLSRERERRESVNARFRQFYAERDALQEAKRERRSHAV